ncbi:MAG: DUF4124 domain-containing protein [Burkholderiaceae bacterium]
MVKPGQTTLIALAALLAFGPAQGQYPGADEKRKGPSIYTCVDAQGHRHTSDRPIEACAKQAMRELRSDGATKREIPAPLTRAQREAKAAQAAADRVREMRERQQRARDQALLRAYPTLADLHTMRDRRIAELQERIEENYARMVELHETLQATQREIASHPAGKAPEELKIRVARLASEILAEDALVKSRQREQGVVRERFGEDAARLQKLLKMQAEADRHSG